MLKNTKHKWLVMLICLISQVSAWAQTRQLTGKVTDAKDGSGLPGVSILLKGSGTGANSDGQGSFSIIVPETGAVLVFSMMGMKTKEVEVGAQMVINVALEEEAKDLRDVVVTAAGIERNVRGLGYSTQKIDGNQLVNARETNVLNALSGKVAGVQVTTSSGMPGASSVVKIRGNNSISGSSDPLYVIDGVPLSNDEVSSAQERDGNTPYTQGVGNSNRLIDLNPDDIESMTVLKGAAATALYGVRAGNGAIVIKTKRGGYSGKKGPSISYSTSYQVDQVNKLPDVTNKWSQGNRGKYLDPSSAFSGSWGALIDTLRFTKPGDGSPWDSQLRDIVGKNDPDATSNAVNPIDNAANFFQNGHSYNNSLTLSGGNGTTKYYASYSRMQQSGIIPLSDFTRNSVRLTAETQISEKLSFTASVNYTNSGGRRIQQGSNLSGLMLGMLRTPASFDNSNGLSDPVNDERSYFFPDLQLQRTYRGYGIYDNPYFTINRNPFSDRVNRLISFGELNYFIKDWLRATYRMGVDMYTDNRSGGFDIGSSAYDAGRVFEDKNFRRDLNSDFILTANKNITEDLNVTAIVGHNGYSSSSEKLYSQGDGMITRNFYSLANTNSIISYTGMNKLQRFGVYGDVTVAYKNRYFLNITGRNDWSSTLPKGKNSFFYPGANLSYVFTEDLGLSENEWFNFGKIRVSAAQVGRDAPTQALKTVYGPPTVGDGYTSGILFPSYGVPGFGIGTSSGSTSPVLGNLNIKPEMNNTIEIGGEFKFFKNRLTIDATYYNISNTNQIILAPVPSSSGFQYAYTNSGKNSNKGIELVVNARPIETKDFSWDATVNYTRNRSNVEALAPGIDQIFLAGFTGSGSYVIPGQPYGVFYGGVWERDTKGNKVIGSDGYPLISAQQAVISNPNPDFLLGFRNTFTYKFVSLSVLLDSRVGGKIWNGTKGALAFFGRAKITESRNDSTIFDGVLADEAGKPTDIKNTAKVPLDQNWWRGNGGGFGNQSEDFVEDATWVRIREITLSVNVPKTITEKLHFAGLNVSVYARNPVLWTKYSGIDPETNLTGGGNSGFGLDYFNMPNTKSYGASLRITF